MSIDFYVDYNVLRSVCPAVSLILGWSVYNIITYMSKSYENWQQVKYKEYESSRREEIWHKPTLSQI